MNFSNQMPNVSKNMYVELLRFIFACIVLMVHTHGFDPMDINHYPFAGGYIAVEFFLILTGFFMAKTCLKSKDTSSSHSEWAIKYIIKKYLRWLPTLSIVVLLHYISMAILNMVDLQDMPYMVYEIMLLQQSGIHKTFFVLPLWYLSDLILVSPIIAYFLKRKAGFFVNILTVLLPIIIYGYICSVNIDLDIWRDPIYMGLLRTIAGLCMGVNSYKLFVFLGKYRGKRLNNVIFGILGIALFAAVIIYILFFSFTYADYFLVFLLMLAISFSFAGELDIKGSVGKICGFLGNLSFPLYCSHWTIRAVIPKIINGLEYDEYVPIYIAISLIYALIICFAAKAIKKMAVIIEGKLFICSDYDV